MRAARDAVIALAFERGWALALLALPLALLLWSLRARAARALATSDLALWSTGDPRDARARPRFARRVPPALALALLSMCAGVLAFAGPRRAEERARWTCVLDTSASMSLPLGASTRAAGAIEAARALAREHDAELSWIAPAFGGEALDTPDPAWSSAAEARPTSYDAWDVPAVLWVTDVAPIERPRRAGYVASGGAAVPGAVAVDGADLVAWDGERLARRADAAPRRVLRVEGVPAGPFERVLAAWAAARGVAIEPTTQGDASVVLRVRAVGGATAREVEAGRDGWSARGTARGVADRALRPWIVHAGVPLVATRPGLLELAWIPGEPSDAAAFAVSWARALDEHALAPAGIVPLEERTAAGPAASAVPSAAPRASTSGWAPALAAIAALLALAASIARRA